MTRSGGPAAPDRHTAAAGHPAAAGHRALDRGSPLPLWAQLREDLRRRLADGAFVRAFPSELDLVEEYRVSRHTVRSALRDLRSQGLVVAERGRRPRVAGPAPITQPLGALYSLFASVEAAGLHQASVVRSRDVRADPAVARRLGLDGAAPLFRLERLRLAGEEPLALDTVWLPADIAAPLLDADFSHTALYDELAARAGVRLDGGHEHIRAVIPTREQQRLLDVPAGVGAFAIDRLGYFDGRTVEWRHTLIRGDRFALAADFSARTGYRLTAHGGYPQGSLPLAATAAGAGS